MKKLTKKQKRANKRVYDTIRKEYNAVKDKADIKISYKQFKNRVIARKEAYGTTWKEAAKREARTETFLSAAERSRENLIEAIKDKHREAYNEIRNLSRDKGRFVSIKDNLVWDKERNGYLLGGKYFIDVTNSPEEVTITEIND